MIDGGFWVFGYGSLMWKPGFEFIERRLARLDGYKRAFSLRSHRYRGTPEDPGLVLGLDWAPGESCTGMAFRIGPELADATRSYLSDRELVTRSYFETLYPVTLLGEPAERVDAICYVLDRSHPQYCGGLDLEEQARIIARCVGPSGRNCEYLHNTVEHLVELGVEDAELVALDARVRELKAAAGA